MGDSKLFSIFAAGNKTYNFSNITTMAEDKIKKQEELQDEQLDEVAGGNFKKNLHEAERKKTQS